MRMLHEPTTCFQYLPTSALSSQNYRSQRTQYPVFMPIFDQSRDSLGWYLLAISVAPFGLAPPESGVLYARSNGAYPLMLLPNSGIVSGDAHNELTELRMVSPLARSRRHARPCHVTILEGCQWMPAQQAPTRVPSSSRHSLRSPAFSPSLWTFSCKTPSIFRGRCASRQAPPPPLPLPPNSPRMHVPALDRHVLVPSGS